MIQNPNAVVDFNDYVLANPVGIDRIVKSIQMHLSNTLPWLEKSFNRATVFSHNITDDNGDVEATQVFPAVWVGDALDKENMIANDNWSAYSFFATLGEESIFGEYNDIEDSQYERELRLYFWVNMERVDPTKTYDYLEELIQEVKVAVRTTQFLESNYGISITGTVDNPLEVYDGFDVDITKTQLLYYPYGGFRINMNAIYDDQVECNVIIPTPTSLVATAIGTDQIDLTWNDNTGGDYDFYEIWRGTTSGNLTQIDTTVDAGNYSDTGLDPNTEYFHQVRASYQGDTSGFSNEASATTDGLSFDFYTNLDALGTFDPLITYSGADVPRWVFEDGSELTGESISTLGSDVGLNGTTQKVSLFLDDYSSVTSFVSGSDNLIDTIDTGIFSGATFSAISINSNAITGALLGDIDYTEGFAISIQNNNLSTFEINTSSTSRAAIIDVSGNSISTFDRGLLNYENSRVDFANNSLLTFDVGAGDSFVFLDLSGNNISSIPNSDLIDFTSPSSTLNISGNSGISAFPLGAVTGKLSALLMNNTSTNNFDVSGLGIGALDVNNSVYRLDNKSLTAAEVNKHLVDCANIYNVGFTGRAIIAGGNNAAPDAFSGGYNGIAALITLLSIGVTVTTS